MRIMTFPMLIHREETKASTLKNCPVVIDGQNYLYYTYEESRLPFVFGCEANEYARHLRLRFQKFKKAGVKCYVVFKGGDTDIEKKIKKFKQPISNFNSNTEFVAPVLLRNVMMQVLDEMNIDYSICMTESKDECVALAQKLKCPVISFDIEYCFRKACYISHLTLKFNDATNAIRCRQYKLQDFLQKYSLTEEKVAIFVALSDTHIFPPNFFDSLFQTWGISDVDLTAQLKNLIKWLTDNTEDEAIKGISKVLSNDDDNNTFLVYYDKILTNMRKDGKVNMGKDGDVTNYLINSNFTIERQDPKWFEKGVAGKHISPQYVNLYKWKVIEGSWVIEDKKSRDSLLLSIDIIKYAYNLLKNFKRDKIKVYQDADTYVEIDTEDPNITMPSYNCKVSVFENGWSQVKRLKLFEHFLGEKKINTEELGKLPVEGTVMFIALVYYARKKKLENVNVSKEVCAILVSYVMLNVVFDKEGSYKKKNNDINEADCKEACLATQKYFNCTKNEAQIIFDGEALKKFVEFQFCLLHINCLNTLCGSPYKPTRYHRMYNGTFVFKMFCDLRERDNDVFINELFQKAPSVLTFVKKLVNVYQKLLTTEQ